MEFKRIFVFIAIFFHIFFTKHEKVVGTVYLKNSKYEIKNGVLDSKGVAFGSVDTTIYEKGFDTFIVTTNAGYEDDEQAYSAGFVEGYIQKTRIGAMISFMQMSGPIHSNTLKFVEDQYYWAKNNKNNQTDKFINMMLIYKQIEGVKDGFNLASGKNYTLWEFIYYSVIDQTYVNILFSSANEKYNLKRIKTDHCTSLIKLLPGNSDIIFGQNLWYSYGVLSLQYKEYHFNFHNKGVKSNTLYEIGWAGVLDSSTHFVISEKNIILTETSLDVMNATKLLDYLTPTGFPTTLMVILGLRMSSTAKEFLELFLEDNIGTFMSQWNILDMNKFVPGKPLPPETLFFVENMPQIFEYQDISNNLTQATYIGSYNTILSDKIKDRAGYTSEQKGDLYSYWDCPRAKIFARDHKNATDLESYKKIIRYDDWKNEPISEQNSKWITAARGDLLNTTLYPSNFQTICSGCLDGKVISVLEWLNKKKIHFVVSPPFTNNPPFKFSTSPCSVISNPYIPDEWNFDWEVIDSTQNAVVSGCKPNPFYLFSFFVLLISLILN